MIGCNHKTEKFPHDIDIGFFKESDIVFRNDEFKNLLDDLLRQQPISPSNGYNSVLVYLSLYKNDTLMVVMNCPPFEKEELKAYHYYNSYRIHFYAPKELEKKLATSLKYHKLPRPPNTHPTPHPPPPPSPHPPPPHPPTPTSRPPLPSPHLPP